MKDEELYRGDLVEVRSPSEILATLDESGALAGGRVDLRSNTRALVRFSRAPRAYRVLRAVRLRRHGVGAAGRAVPGFHDTRRPGARDDEKRDAPRGAIGRAGQVIDQDES